MASLTDSEIRRFVNVPGGGLDFGHVREDDAATLGVKGGPIRLQQGIPGSKGFGNLHVESYPDRMRQLQSLGYASCAAFVLAVGANYQRIGEGGGSGKLALIYQNCGHDLQIIVRYNDAGFWGVTTGLPYRVARCKILLEVSRTGGSEPTPKPAVASRFATLSLPRKSTLGGSGS